MQSSSRIVFSTLFNESDDYLRSYVQNFLIFGGSEAVLMVNFPPSRSIDPSLAAGSDRVLMFSGDEKRSKLGHTLLIGHLEAFAYASERIDDFGYFCPMATNSLFVRAPDIGAIAPALEIVRHRNTEKITDLPDSWWWKVLRQCPQFLSEFENVFGLDRCAANQIEGFLATRADWMEIYRRADDIARVAAILPTELLVPFEEFIPATFVNAFGSGRHVSICKNFWDRGPQYPVRIDDLVSLETKLSAHACAMKWFERSPMNAATRFVTDRWGAALLSRTTTVMQAERPARLVERLMHLELAGCLQRQDNYQPFGRAWFDATHAAQPLDLSFDLTIDGKVFALSDPGGCFVGSDIPYIYTEPTGRQIKLGLRITQTATTRISIAASPIDASAVPSGPDASGSSQVQGYIYLSPSIANAAFTVRLRTDGDGIDDAAFLQHIVVRRGDHYRQETPVVSLSANDISEQYYTNDLADGSAFWIGIPFYATMQRYVRLDLMLSV